jgi:hypothetical protein
MSFQSIFSFRAGGMLPRGSKDSITRLVRNASINTFISKILTTVFIGVFAVTTFVPIRLGSFQGEPRAVFAGGISAYLSIVLSLVTIMGLQVSTSFVSAKILDVLAPLPLSKKEISSVIFLCFVRIFDIPLVSSVVILVIMYLFAGGSAIGSLAVLTAIVITEIFALALTIGLARFFYSRVVSSGGRSKWKALLRVIFTLVWILPSFGTYFVINFSDAIVQSFASTTQALTSGSQLLLVAYPFSFGFLAAFATFPQNITPFVLTIASAASIGYVILAAFALRWVIRSISNISMGAVSHGSREVVKDTSISPQKPWLGIIRKDLRVASRAPSYASLFLLPPLETALISLSFASSGEIRLAATLGILVGVSLVTLVLPPMLISLEGLASSYVRSLPLTKRTVISGKVILSAIMYASSMLILILIVLYLGRDVATIITFGAIQMLAVIAASLLELILSIRKFWKEGFAMGNLYARLSTYIAIVIPGLVLALAPIVGAVATYVLATNLTIPIYLATALAEFVLMALISYRM